MPPLRFSLSNSKTINLQNYVDLPEPTGINMTASLRMVFDSTVSLAGFPMGMIIFERESSTLFAFGSITALRRSGKQQINDLWPGWFVNDKIYEKKEHGIFHNNANVGER